MFSQARTNPSTAVSNWKGRRDSKKGHPSTAVSTWLNGGLFGGPMEYTTTGSPTVTVYGAYTSLTYTGGGNFVITAGARDIDFCVIAGGGTGGSMAGGGAGGGGAGGMYVGTAAGLTVGTHTVSVGSGGSGWSAGFWSYGEGRDGSSSSFTPDGASAFTANGGGGGGYLTSNGRNGGCGGGAGADNNTPNGGNPQGGAVTGFAGGSGDGATPSGYDWGGGGGGTAAAGQNAWDYSAGTGGNGATNDYGTGVAVQRAGGGGGTSSNGLPASARDRLGGAGGGTQGFAGQAPLAAAANTGSGVGGCDRGWGQGNGGSGIVILRWLT